MKVSKIGVIGCGQMGSGIAQVCARAGYPVLVSDVDAALLKKGLETIKASLGRAVQKGVVTAPEAESALARIEGTTKFADFGDRDLVIEAAVEDLAVKKDIFTALDRACPPATVLATNTSCLSVAAMAAVTGRPDKVLGMHFFNPVPVMKLLEIVRTDLTAAETLETARQVGETLGKTIIVARDEPGFIVNRLMIPQVLDAITMLENGLATREDIDAGMTLGLNHPMGPLTLADLIGLDTVLLIANGIHDKLREPQYAAPALLKELVAARRLGRKSRQGFYDYK